MKGDTKPAEEEPRLLGHALYAGWWAWGGLTYELGVGCGDPFEWSGLTQYGGTKSEYWLRHTSSGTRPLSSLVFITARTRAKRGSAVGAPLLALLAYRAAHARKGGCPRGPPS